MRYDTCALLYKTGSVITKGSTSTFCLDFLKLSLNCDLKIVHKFLVNNIWMVCRTYFLTWDINIKKV